MKKLLVALLVLLSLTIAYAAEGPHSSFEWNGAIALTDENGNLTTAYGDWIPDTAVLTDVAPTRTYILGTGAINDLSGALLADKGCTLTVYPLTVHKSSQRSAASVVLTIANGGVTESTPWIYSELSAPRAEVVVTKTEAGDMTSYSFTARGR